MRKIDRLNPLAREMADALLAAFPQFQKNWQVTATGDFSAESPAPRGSNVVGMKISTYAAQDVWIQFGVPNAMYSIDTEKELIKIVGGLLSDRLMFTVLKKKGRWVETTIIRHATHLKIRRGEIATIHSWSGKKDDVIGVDPGKRTPVSSSAKVRRL